MTPRVVLDPGSGDPAAARAAVEAALGADAAVEIALVGPYDRAHVDDLERCTLHPATGTLDPDRDPAVAVRGRADLPVRVAVDLLAAGGADAIVSASPVAAVLTAVRFALPRRRGVREPLLGARVTTPGGRIRWVCDVSGRRDVTPKALAEAADQLGGAVGVLTPTDRPGAVELERRDALAARSPVVEMVPLGSWADAEVDVLVADGAVGAALLSGVAVAAADSVGTVRVLGVDAVVLLPVSRRPEDLAAAVAKATEEVIA